MRALCRVWPVGHDVLWHQSEGYQDGTEGGTEDEESGRDAGGGESGVEEAVVGECEPVTGRGARGVGGRDGGGGEWWSGMKKRVGGPHEGGGCGT